MRARLAVPALVVLAAAGDAPAQDHPGKAVYDRWCAGCHGTDGRGDGPAAAWMLPRPRDFTQARYQVRTTATGELPTDADILHVIDVGMPGTTMPGWRRQLTGAERNALVDYLKSFSHFFAQGPAPTPLSFGRPPRASDELLAEGRRFYESIECWRCHGDAGRGDGQSAPTLEDDDGFPIRAADLTQPWLFNGGARVEDIYRRLRTGLDGTPMPTFSDLIDAGFMTDEQLWAVAHYVRSLAPARLPVLRDVVRAHRIEDGLPSGPDDPVWAGAEPFYLPLVGQIVVKPRWFAPSVHGVWIEALHDDRELAIRVSWTDPSRSPAPDWADWRRRVLAVMEPREWLELRVPAAGGDADGAAAADTDIGPLPDAIALQFPRSVPAGMERPYFLMGSPRDPVYLWHWRSEPEAAAELLGRGPGAMAPLGGAAVALRAEAVWNRGQWRVVFRRALAAGGDPDRLDFQLGTAIPMAIHVWDGDHGEEGTRGAISTWYFLYLDRPTPARVYTAPLAAVLITAGLGFFAVGRAQRKHREAAAGAES
jgi:DMSO reductase family type II enzyme heme b subunit